MSVINDEIRYLRYRNDLAIYALEPYSAYGCIFAAIPYTYPSRDGLTKTPASISFFLLISDAVSSQTYNDLIIEQSRTTNSEVITVGNIMDLMEDPMLMDLAEAGDIRAQYDLGMSRYNQNEKSAIQWLGKAAEQGNVRAQYVLGSIYIEGEFVDQDLKKAFDLIDSCSMLGDPECTFILGMFYEKGYGVVKPNTDIAEWYQREAAVYGVQRAIVTCVRESRSASTKMEESNNSNDEPCFRNSLHDLE